jgi:hypothetical protein
MSLNDRISVIRVKDESDRQQAVAVLRATYHLEKHWIEDEEHFCPESDLANEAVSWFVVRVDDQPVGVLRVLYDPPLNLYNEYGFKLIVPNLDIERFVREHRIAEIGRFAVLPEYRRYIVVVIALMRAASMDTVTRGYTHYITDIFEGELHNPYQFHTRVMGFQPVATHDVGELNCPNRRITMILNLKSAYQRLRTSRNWVFRFLTDGWNEKLHQQLMAETSSSGRAVSVPR